jgi:indole-3-glycerol phosphate synthase
MDSILKTITDRIIQDESANFEAFSPGRFILEKRKKPVDTLSLLGKDFFVIAEVKKGSPSRGIIREDLDPVELALGYERGGASAVSVITEKNFFHGEKHFLTDVKNHISLPVLRKDFLVHPFQVYESFNLGADFILLITACLTDAALKKFYDMSLSLGMQALVEVHNEDELERALKINPAIVGINNRDLKTFQVDVGTSFRLKPLIPRDIYVISESGIESHQDIAELKHRGFSGVLIGESLLRQKNVTRALKKLVHG